MGYYRRAGRPFLLAALIITSAIASIAAGQGRGPRTPRMGGKGANLPKVGGQRPAQQRAERRPQRQGDVRQDTGRPAGDQTKTPGGQDQQKNRTVDPQGQQPKPGQNQPPAGRPRPALDRQEMMRQNILKQIGLNPEQQERMVRIRNRHDDEIRSTGRTIREAQRGVDEAIMNPQYNEAEINRRIEDLAQAHADQVRLRQRIRAEIRQVLTPEQVMRFNQVQREIQQKNQELKRIEMQQTSPDKSPSGDQSQASPLPLPDMVDVFIARRR